MTRYVYLKKDAAAIVEKLEAEIERLKAERRALQAEVKRLTNELYVDGIAPVPEEPKP